MDLGKCPACGAAVVKSAPVCPLCGLEAPVRRFASRSHLEAWLREVVVPHRQTLQPRVYVGMEFGLILTGSGKLYGIGSNAAGQLLEPGTHCWYDAPVLMAEEVISAAAGMHYSIYVTRDGEVHLQGRGEMAERFSGFSGAAEVYALYVRDTFCIRAADGTIWGFGLNSGMEPDRKQVLHTFGEEVCDIRSGYFMEPWTYGYNRGKPESDEHFQRQIILTRLQEREEYRRAVEAYGGANVQIQLTKTGRRNVECGPECMLYEDMNAGKAYYFPESQLEKVVGDRHNTWHKKAAHYRFDKTERTVFRTELVVCNRELYTPVCYQEDPEITGTPNRWGSFPLPESWMAEQNIPVLPEGKKVATDSKYCLWLMGDGTLADREGNPVWRPDEPVADVSMSDHFVLLVCRNGELYWQCTTWEPVFRKVEKDQLKQLRLPQ